MTEGSTTPNKNSTKIYNSTRNLAEIGYRFRCRIRGPADGHGSAATTSNSDRGRSVAAGSIGTRAVVVVDAVVVQQQLLGGIFLVLQEAIVLGGRL